MGFARNTKPSFIIPSGECGEREKEMGNLPYDPLGTSISFSSAIAIKELEHVGDETQQRLGVDDLGEERRGRE